MSTQLGRLPVPAMGMCFHYYDGRCRTSQRDQLRQIRELGFDVIHTEESPVAPGRPRGTLDPIVAWNHIEIGRNRYDWGFLDRLVEDCAAVGLQLFHDIELVHHLPGWVARQYPDTEVISPTGERLGFYHRPFCYADYHMRCYSLAHPAARAAAAAFMGKVARRYAGSPTVVGYILMEEIGLNYPHALTWYGQDIGPATVAGFRQYLEKRYGTLAELNRRYGIRYRSLAAAAADRTIFAAHPRPHRGWLDWCCYRSEYVARFFREVRDAIKQADPAALVVASAIDVYPSYWIVQGFRTETFGFMDLIAEKNFGAAGTQSLSRSLFALARSGRTEVGMSNMNDLTPGVDIPTWDMTRRVFAALGMGTRWNALYAWHWYSHEDATTGKRVLHANLRGFLPYLRWIRQHREFLGGLRYAGAGVAILKPVRSEAVRFWQHHDPRLRRKSHSSPCLFTQQGCRIQEMLGDENIAFDLVAEECLAEELSSGRYRLLVLIDSHVTGDTARVIRAWVEKGGKLLLMPGAGRFDEAGAERGHFDDLVRHHNVLSLLYRDFRGWEGDGAFPEGAKAILVESASGLQIPHLLQWAGAKRALEFVDDSPPPRLEVGAGQEKIPTGNPYQRRISVYPLVDATGSDVFVLVQRGTDTEPIAGVRVVWNGGPVQAWLPPSSRPIRLVPVKGELILPSWRDVLIIAASRSGRVAAGQAGRRPRRPPGRARARRG